MAKRTPAVPFDGLLSREHDKVDRLARRLALVSIGLNAEELMRLAVNAERWVYDNKCVNDCEYFIADEPSRPARCPYFKADRTGKRTCAGYRKDETAQIIRDWRSFREQAELFQKDLAYYREHGELPARS